MAEFLNCSLETLAGLDDKNIIDKKMLPEDKQKLIDEINTATNKEEARLIAKAAYDLLDDEGKELIKNKELLNEPEPKKGCGGSVYGSITSIVLLGIVMILSRRKRGEL